MRASRKSEYNRWLSSCGRSLQRAFVCIITLMTPVAIQPYSPARQAAADESTVDGAAVRDAAISSKNTMRDSTLWEFNARAQPAQPNQDCLNRMVIRQAKSSHWQNSSLEDFSSAAAGPDGKPIRTIVYVHGNWTSAEDARQRGWLLYHRLTQRAKRPLRFVIYSWDSERHGGITQDLKSKLSRLDTESYRLARVLETIPEPAPIGLVGYSFGGAVVCGALQLASGSELAGMKLDAELPSDADIRVNFYAPAFDRGELAPYGKYGHAFEVVDRVVNVFNSKDPALKRFRFLAPSHAPVAAGYAGLVSYRKDDKAMLGSSEGTPDIVQVDVAKQVGKTHSEMNYIQNCASFNYLLKNLVGL